LLAEKYILKDTNFYKKLSKSFSRFDNFFNLNPLRWFAVWTLIVSGGNVVLHLENRWIYWDWSSFSVYALFALAISSLVDFIFNTKVSNKNNQSLLFEQLAIFTYGTILFIIGANPLNLSFNLLFFGFPYILFFMAGNLIWKIPLDIFNSPKIQKSDFALSLVSAMICIIFALSIGYYNDDPMMSTIAAVFLPFPIVALVFPSAIRHLQRCRMYVVFIPAMFLSMRYPWFLFMILPLFLFSRYYYYFTNGDVIPTLKVNEPDPEIIN
jgi:hypothetical protein